MGIDRVALVAVVTIAAACGDDNGKARIDAADNGDDGGGSGSDASIDAFAVTTIPCGYTEMADSTNSTVPNAESSGLTFSTTPIALCGKFDTGHYSASTNLVDADGIAFNVAADADVIVHLTGSGIAMPDRTIVQILKKGENALFGFGVVEGDHATLIFRLPAGTDYVAAAYALDGAATSTAIDYKIVIAADTPRCPAKTGTADHTEGADNGANDVIDFNFIANTQSTLTTSNTDAPETTNVTVASDSSYLISGSSSNVDPMRDDYKDHDTYAFTTGATTTQMSLRLKWPSTATDLDVRVYPVPTGDPESIVAGIDMSAAEEEYETFAVKPSTTYWLWIAAEDSSSAATAYAATLCGETFTP
jgi:hypothetical protein